MRSRMSSKHRQLHLSSEKMALSLFNAELLPVLNMIFREASQAALFVWLFMKTAICFCSSLESLLCMLYGGRHFCFKDAVIANSVVLLLVFILFLKGFVLYMLLRVSSITHIIAT